MNTPTPILLWFYSYILMIILGFHVFNNGDKQNIKIEELCKEINELKSPKTLLLPLPNPNETLNQEN